MPQMKYRHEKQNSHLYRNEFEVTRSATGERFYDMELCHIGDPNACGGQPQTYACLKLFGNHPKCFRRCDARGIDDCEVYNTNIGVPQNKGEAICAIPHVNPIEIGAAGVVPAGIPACAIRSEAGNAGFASPRCSGFTLPASITGLDEDVVFPGICTGKCPNAGFSSFVGLATPESAEKRCH